MRRPIRPRAGIVNSRCVSSPRVVHLDALGPAVADQLHHRARRDAGGTSTTRYSIGSMRLAVDFLDDDARLADRQLEAFAAHVLEQDPRCSRPRPETWNSSRLSSLGTTRRATFDSSSFISRSRSCRLVTYLPSWPTERRVVDAEDHVERRLVDRDRRQGDRVVEVGDRVADVDVVQADHGADVAGADLVGLDAAEAVEDVELRDRVVDALAVVLEQGDALALAGSCRRRPGRWRCGRRSRCSRA